MLMSHPLLTQFLRAFIIFHPFAVSVEHDLGNTVVSFYPWRKDTLHIAVQWLCNILQRCISQTLEGLLESESELLAHGCCILDSIFATCFDFGDSKHFVLPRPCLLVNTSDCSATIIDCTYGQGVGDLARWWCHDDVIWKRMTCYFDLWKRIDWHSRICDRMIVKIIRFMIDEHAFFCYACIPWSTVMVVMVSFWETRQLFNRLRCSLRSLLVFDEVEFLSFLVLTKNRLGLAQVLTNLTVRHRVRVASKAQISIGLPCLYHCIISIFYIFYYMFFRIS